MKDMPVPAMTSWEQQVSATSPAMPGDVVAV